MTPQASSPARGSPRSRIAAMLSQHRNFLFTFVLLFAAWEIAVHVLKVPRYILPAPTGVWEGFLTQPGRMLWNTWVTVQIIVVGYGIAVLVRLPPARLIG